MLVLAFFLWNGKKEKGRSQDPLASSGIAPTKPLPALRKRSERQKEPKRQKTNRLGANFREGRSHLLLTIQSKEGKKLSGKVYWVEKKGPPVTSSMLAPEYGFPLPKNGVHIQSHQGEAHLEITSHHWTWLRVTGRFQKGRLACNYLRIPPFSGTKRKILLLDPTKRSVFVFLVHKDLETPVSHGEVRLFRQSMASMAVPSLVRKKKTDATGYVSFQGLEPGRFALLAPGAREQDKMPYVQRFILPAQASMTDLPLTLVQPETRYTLRLRVVADIKGAPKLPPKFFLKRKADQIGELYPMQGVLRSGSQELKFFVPLGDYELGALPLGRLRFSPGTNHFSFTRDQQVFPISVQEDSQQTYVELVGLGFGDFPVSVFPRPKEPLFDDQMALMFCGPFHWKLAKQMIPLPSGSFDFLVYGRSGTWVSQKTLQIDHPKTLRIPLVPATRLSLTWKKVPWKVGRRAVLQIRTSRRLSSRVLSRRFAPEGGRMDPAFVSTIVVERGPVTLTCFDSEQNNILWKRMFQATKPAKALLVLGPRGKGGQGQGGR